MAHFNITLLRPQGAFFASAFADVIDLVGLSLEDMGHTAKARENYLDQSATNILFGYTPRVAGLYYLAGTGAAAVSVSWEERSATDTSLGTPLPGGGSKDEEDGADGALIAAIGIGYTFGGGLDVRAELPVLIFVGGVGEASTIAPTFTVALGYRF